MSARDVVLGRLRAALDGAAKPADVPREYRPGGDLPAGDAQLIDLLADRLTDYRAVVHRVDADVAAAVEEILAAASAGRPKVLVPPGVPAEWLPEGVDVIKDDGLDADTLAAVDGVVTGAAVAVAETGTIVLDASPDQGRRIITLLPDLHICVLKPAQVVASVPEAIARISPGRPLTWISGPSATSDIELNRVEGVHGPRRLHVIIWEGTA
jgi:L-lactate dehydrogenase complex protein LldG